jgi:5-carboxymethyl-2-hydroxymuconic-semialdehyde dehydrogenase
MDMKTSPLALLKDPSLLKTDALINGQWVKGSNRFDIHDPATGAKLADVANLGAAEAEQAISAANAALPAWRGKTSKERSVLLRKWYDLLMANVEDLGRIMTAEQGKPLAEAKGEVMYGASFVEWYAEEAKRVNGETLPQFDNTRRLIVIKQPIGVCAAITPWNFPLAMITRKVAPALAAGCTVVHKPAEFSPLSARLLVEIAEEAGLPKGVWNLVNGLGDEAGKALTEHPLIRAIGFVGESRTGSMIMAQGAKTLKRVHFELGGKNPVIVFDDADIDRAVDAAVFMIYSLNGERCTSSSRLLVQDTIYDSFTAKVAARAKAIKVGHPLDPETEVGPLIHPLHEKKVLSYFDIARADGATVAAGGEKAEGPGGGCYVQPTLFTGAHNKMRIAQEEIFGPVLTAIPFADEAEALAVANDVPYGLAAYLWTQDVTRAFRFSEGVQAGMVWVNSENNRHLPAPFGGSKDSGIGRDGGDWSFDFYMETKNICFATTAHAIPKLGK